MLKAIQTQYKGYKFRSRLEARWAVFFDAMGFDWEYEPEGFELPDGTWYLPDFRVMKNDYETGRKVVKFWAEIKGGVKKGEDMAIKDKIKISLFANSTNEPCLVLGDMPEHNHEHSFSVIEKIPYRHEKVKGHILQCSLKLWGMYGFFDDLPSDSWRYIDFPIGSSESVNYRIGLATTEKIIKSIREPDNSINKFKITNIDFLAKRGIAAVIDAYDKARQARFEHGETPC